MKLEIPERKDFPQKFDEITSSLNEFTEAMNAIMDSQQEKIRKEKKIELDVPVLLNLSSAFKNAMGLAFACVKEIDRLEETLSQVGGEYDMLTYLKEHKASLEKLIGGEL